MFRWWFGRYHSSYFSQSEMLPPLLSFFQCYITLSCLHTHLLSPYTTPFSHGSIPNSVSNVLRTEVSPPSSEKHRLLLNRTVCGFVSSLRAWGGGIKEPVKDRGSPLGLPKAALGFFLHSTFSAVCKERLECRVALSRVTDQSQ